MVKGEINGRIEWLEYARPDILSLTVVFHTGKHRNINLKLNHGDMEMIYHDLCAPFGDSIDELSRIKFKGVPIKITIE